MLGRQADSGVDRGLAVHVVVGEELHHQRQLGRPVPNRLGNSTPGQADDTACSPSSPAALPAVVGCRPGPDGPGMAPHPEPRCGPHAQSRTNHQSSTSGDGAGSCRPPPTPPPLEAGSVLMHRPVAGRTEVPPRRRRATPPTPLQAMLTIAHHRWTIPCNTATVGVSPSYRCRVQRPSQRVKHVPGQHSHCLRMHIRRCRRRSGPTTTPSRSVCSDLGFCWWRG